MERTKPQGGQGASKEARSTSPLPPISSVTDSPACGRGLMTSLLQPAHRLFTPTPRATALPLLFTPLGIEQVERARAWGAQAVSSEAGADLVFGLLAGTGTGTGTISHLQAQAMSESAGGSACGTGGTQVAVEAASNTAWGTAGQSSITCVAEPQTGQLGGDLSNSGSGAADSLKLSQLSGETSMCVTHPLAHRRNFQTTTNTKHHTYSLSQWCLNMIP